MTNFYIESRKILLNTIKVPTIIVTYYTYMLHARLEKNVIALIIFLSQNGLWKCTRLNLTAVCITVAEVLLMQAIFYARVDKGLLHQLCILQ
jgi:hypothetical protein